MFDSSKMRSREGERERMKKLYMKTTGDKLDLPVAVADSPGELAAMVICTKMCTDAKGAER